jgi:hypothetical protein
MDSVYFFLWNKQGGNIRRADLFMEVNGFAENFVAFSHRRRLFASYMRFFVSRALYNYSINKGTGSKRNRSNERYDFTTINYNNLKFKHYD